MALKFGDPASIAQVKEQARLKAAHAKARQDFSDRAVALLVQWLEEAGGVSQTTIIRGWLDKCYEDRED